MRFLLFRVEHLLNLKGRGIYLMPGLPTKEPATAGVESNDQIRLGTPEGRVIDTLIVAIEHAKSLEGSQWPIQTPSGVKPEDVPVGTEVWLL